jgi:hypothetical protein
MSLIFFLSSICLFDLKLLSTLVKMRIFIGKEDEKEEERRIIHTVCRLRVEYPLIIYIYYTYIAII